MTVSTTGNRVSYAGNGVTTVFSFPNKFLLDTDIVVLSVVDATGVATTKVLTTDYTLTGAGGPAGGNVTMLVAPATGTTLVIYRDPPLTQPIDPVNGDPLNVDTTIEAGLDRSTLALQRVRDLIDRSLHIPDGDTGFVAADLAIPAKINRANKFLAFDADGKPLAATSPTTGVLIVSSYIETLLDDVDQRTALNTLLAFTGTAWNFGVITNALHLGAHAGQYVFTSGTDDVSALYSGARFDTPDWRYSKNGAPAWLEVLSGASTPSVAVRFAVAGISGNLAPQFLGHTLAPGELVVNGNTGFTPAFGGAGDAILRANAAASGDTAELLFTKNGVARGVIFSDTTPEGGANAGSLLSFGTYNDAGTFNFTALSFSRATGLGTVAGDPTAALGIATKQYVDATDVNTGVAAAGNLSAAQGASSAQNVGSTFSVAVGDIIEVALNSTGSISGTAGQLYVLEWGASGVTLDAVFGSRGHMCVFGNGAAAAMPASRARVTVGGTCQLTAHLRNVATTAGTITINTPAYNFRVFNRG